MQTVSQRLALLRQRMALRGLDACVVVTDDFHGSEYVGDHFKTRAYLSGFTGSAGTLLVLAEEAYLWTDGRYFLQAERQLTGSGIELMRAGQPGVPTLSAFLAERDCRRAARWALTGAPSAQSCIARWKRRWRTNTSAWTVTLTRRRASGRTDRPCPPRRCGRLTAA